MKLGRVREVDGQWMGFGEGGREGEREREKTREEERRCEEENVKMKK